MENRFTDRVALVTGATSGLGLAIARRFHAEGATVLLTGIETAEGEAAAAELGERASFHYLDTASVDDWQAVMATLRRDFGQLDALVNNAGVTLMGSVEDVTIKDFDRSLAINTRGVFLGCRFAIELMKERKRGAIVNIASVSAFKPMPELVAYNASKAGMALMTQSIALHCGRSGYGIRCNSINPGVILTPMLGKVIEQVEDGEALMDSYKAMHPLGRIGDPGDIASMAAYLCSDEAAFITGSAFNVDGGLGINS